MVDCPFQPPPVRRSIDEAWAAFLGYLIANERDADRIVREYCAARGVSATEVTNRLRVHLFADAPGLH
jgi:hypothetical protein